jgi:hypothetical protein
MFIVHEIASAAMLTIFIKITIITGFITSWKIIIFFFFFNRRRMPWMDLHGHIQLDRSLIYIYIYIVSTQCFLAQFHGKTNTRVGIN